MKRDLQDKAAYDCTPPSDDRQVIIREYVLSIPEKHSIMTDRPCCVPREVIRREYVLSKAENTFFNDRQPMLCAARARAGSAGRRSSNACLDVCVYRPLLTLV